MHIEVPPEGECDYYEKVPFSKNEIKAMLFYGRTESVQHRQTKGVIASVLAHEPDIVNVAVEEVAKNIGKSWRKPDIRADFEDKTVVFEVQLSPIFHHVILERNDAYRDNGWYICWIFDDVNEDNPIMRELDAWINNNYNLFGFDDEAKAATEKSGRLHLTVKYYGFSIIEDGLNSRLSGEWHTETVQFSNLTFDADKRMVYLYDSNSEKQECIRHIENIITDCRKQAEIETERRIEKERKRRIEDEERQRILQEQEEVTEFIYNIPDCVFPTEMYRLVLEYLEQFSEEGISVLLSSIKDNIKSFEKDALNKWLKVVCEIVRLQGEGVLTAKYLWNEVIYSFEQAGRNILYLSIKDYLSVMGVSDYGRALVLLTRPIDDDASDWLNSISASDQNFEYYAPLIILNRYYKAKHNIPKRIAKFFAEKTKEIWCLISAQQGYSFGYDNMNLKQIANLVCNSYPDIANLFLYLIERNGFTSKISEVKIKPGKKLINHYQRLNECIKEHRDSQTTAINLDELNILFPTRKRVSPSR